MILYVTVYCVYAVEFNWKQGWYRTAQSTVCVLCSTVNIYTDTDFVLYSVQCTVYSVQCTVHSINVLWVVRWRKFNVLILLFAWIFLLALGEFILIQDFISLNVSAHIFISRIRKGLVWNCSRASFKWWGIFLLNSCKFINLSVLTKFRPAK